MNIHPRVKALFLLLFALIIIAVVFFWIYVGERGTLLLEGDVPDSITGIQLGDQQCKETSCLLTLRPGDYDVTFEKEGYYPITKNIRIYLFEKTTMQLAFTKKPFVQKIGTVQYFSPSLSTIEEKYKDNQNFLPLPFLTGKTNINIDALEAVKEISFSPTREKALILTKEKTYIAGNQTREPVEISYKTSDFIWQEDTVYFWDKKQEENIWELKMLNTETKKISRVALFYNLINPSILPCNEKIIILKPAGAYMVNLQTYEKQEVLNSFHITNGLCDNGAQFLFQTKENGLFLFDTQNRETKELTNVISADTLNHIGFYDSNVLYMQNDEHIRNLVLYDIKKKENKIIFSFPSTEKKEIQKIEVYRNKIYFLMNQDVYVVEGEIRS